MKLPNSLHQFFTNECGLVSVDWLALSLAIIGTSLMVMNAFANGQFQLAESIALELAPPLFQR